MNEEEQTLPDLLTILEAINKLDRKVDGLRQEMSPKIAALEVNVNAKLEEMRLQMMRFDVRQDRFESMVHESLSVAYNVRADVTILREEVTSLITEVRLKNNIGVLP